MAGSLSGKVALVTGASRGIGRAIALKLASEGCDVVANYYNSAEEAQALCAEIGAMGRKAIAVQGSVGIPDSVDEMFAELRKPALEMTLKHWRWCLETNAFALDLLAQRAVPMMPAGSCMIAISSLGASRAMPDYGFIGA